MKNIFLLFVAICSLTLSAQTEVGGVNLPNSVEFENETLKLNGVGVREKFWMDMYAGGLYLQQKSSDAKAIVNADEPMAIKLHIVSGMITPKRMTNAVDEGFVNATGGETSTIDPQIKTFKSFFKEIGKGDVFDLVYLPKKGVKVYKNSNELGTVEGLEFKKALFGIWLSENPADDDLKEGMLNQ